MNISLNWIRDFVELPKVSPQNLGWAVTVHTAEVEAVIDEAQAYENMVVGKVLSVSKHPGADRLNLVQTDLGSGKIVQIVCGGQNLYEGMLVAVAMPGAWVKWHGEGDAVELGETKIRGELSYGMICAGEEIDLPSDNLPGQSEVRIHDLSASKAKVGTPLAKVLGKDDTLLEIDNKSLTHRPDLWGHYGMAREISAIFGKPLKKLDPLLKYKPGTTKEKVSIKIEDNKLCPRFSAAIVTGIEIEESPQWMKARLQAAGMNPHNNVVDITNYVMLELGQPMHAYDRAVVGDDGFTVRYAKKGEKLVTLDETEQKLTEEDPLVCNKSGEPMGLAGIKGGLKSGISDSTSEIILECAAFDPIAVRKASLRHVRTDASQRFEKSLDPTMTEVALKRAINLLQELCPTAKVVSAITTVGAWKPKKIEITVSPDDINSKIGAKVSTKEMVRILKALEFGVKTVGKNLKVTVPSHRATRDVNIAEDIVEEVARIYGYDKIEPVQPLQPMRLPLENEERMYKHLTRSIFAYGLGFTEVVNYSFYSKDRFEKCGIPEEGHIRILNYLSEDQTHMRRSLVPNMLANIATNERSFDTIKIFELGHTYDEEKGQFMPREEKHLGAMVAMDSEPFYAIKGALESYLKTFGVTGYQLHESKYPAPCAHPKKCMDIVVRGQTLGQVFTVHPGTLKAYDIRKNVGAFELRFSPLVQNGRGEKRFKPLAKFPSMSFDVSVLVDKKSKVADLEKAIRSADSEKLIESIALFDIYEGKNIPEDKKSLSYSIEIRHPERTLTEKEFQAMQASAFLAIEKFGGTIRGR